MTPTLPLSSTLTAALAPLAATLPPGRPCALLDYPSYPNLGDHLIWLGSLLYLRDRGCRLVYTASALNFDPAQLEQVLPAGAPILLNGGGNFGNLWPRYQQFREQIVARYPHHPIILLPQTLYFTDPVPLQRAAAVFNRHPQLTLCLRDRRSLAIAQTHFSACQLLLAPDMAFQLAGHPGFEPNPSPHAQGLLYLCRQDREQPETVALDLPQLTIADWPSFDWRLGAANSVWRQCLAWGIRKGWQRGLAHPREWLARQHWQRRSQPEFRSWAQPPWRHHRESWSFVHAGLYQFQHYRGIITNRLHGHILALLIEQPHVFLANRYYKNEAFYETWTHTVPFCTFAPSLAAARPAIDRLLI